jgi:Ran-binding protein 3
MLNSKLWPEMTLDRANDKSLRITALEKENDVKIYLIMVSDQDNLMFRKYPNLQISFASKQKVVAIVIAVLILNWC